MFWVLFLTKWIQGADLNCRYVPKWPGANWIFTLNQKNQLCLRQRRRKWRWDNRPADEWAFLLLRFLAASGALNKKRHSGRRLYQLALMRFFCPQTKISKINDNRWRVVVSAVDPRDETLAQSFKTSGFAGHMKRQFAAFFPIFIW